MAPEYAMFGQFSIKSDVFSFGVLILEIVSGQKNTSYHNGENVEYLLNYVSRNTKGKISFFFFFYFSFSFKNKKKKRNNYENVVFLL